MMKTMLGFSSVACSKTGTVTIKLNDNKMIFFLRDIIFLFVMNNVGLFRLMHPTKINQKDWDENLA